MGKYVCSVCGYIHDEAAGPAWEALSEDWVCPLCGAPKSEFSKQGEAPAAMPPVSVSEASADMKELSALEMAALCSNLARGCERQYKPEEAARFGELAAYFKAAAAPAADPGFDKLLARIESDLAEGFPNANAVSSNAKDRGALRALVWSEKVTRILKSLLARYQKEGDALLASTGVYVCTICGFIYIGEAPPDICPVCKVPNWKFEKVEGR